MKPLGFLGLRTAIYAVKELDKAKAWYAAAAGVTPYFDQPYYVGFNVGGFELGLVPADPKQQPGSSGVVAYWGVESIRTMWDRLLAMGATEVDEIQDVGGGVFVAVVQDPFGNRLGIIENPQFPNVQ